MSANTDPIYSKEGKIEWGAVLTTAAADYTGYSNYNTEVFGGDEEGAFLQKLRFKALGTNTASVARIYINNGLSNQQIITMAGITPTGTAGTAGTIGASSQYLKVVPIGQGGDVGIASSESSAVAISSGSTNGSVLWAWTAPSAGNAAFISAYRIHIGSATGQQSEYFIAPVSIVTGSIATNTLTVTALTQVPDSRICKPLEVGSVISGTGVTADTYISAILQDSVLPYTYTVVGTTTASSTTISTTLKYEQLTPGHAMVNSYDGQVTKNNNLFFGEVSLPATTAIATAATVEIDYPMNIPIPPGYEVYVGLGTTVAAGWHVGAVGGSY